MADPRRFEAPGPFRSDQLRPGDGWELSRGRPIECLPTGGDGASRSSVGARVLATDPAVTSSGLDAGYAPTKDTLRAPDIAIGNVPDQPGWIPGVPPLAVEYAGSGQDERALKEKIADLLDRGTRFIWVVRLDLPRRVEVHAPGEPMVVRQIGELLEAPGILRNDVPVEALFDESVANRLTLRNLLQRAGYESLDAVLDKGKAEGKAEGKVEGKVEGKRETLFRLIVRAGLLLTDEDRARIQGCSDVVALDRWIDNVFGARSATDLFC